MRNNNKPYRHNKAARFLLALILMLVGINVYSSSVNSQDTVSHAKHLNDVVNQALSDIGSNDADGMRTYRNSEYSIKLLVNSQQQYNSSVMYYNLYPSEYYVIHNGNSYTKHVYMDGERVATLLGSDNSLLDNYSNSSITLAGTPFITGNVSQHYAAKRTTKESDLINSLEEVFGYTYSVTDLQNTITYSGAQVTDLPYYFHRDHLGSAALVTDSVGNVDQRIEYTPDGSLFFQTVTGNYRTPYRFNAKEFDDDTELYYFGARYYDNILGIWISPDPMAEDYPGVSSYAYCHGNPVNRIDPDGKQVYVVFNKNSGKLAIIPDVEKINKKLPYKFVDALTYSKLTRTDKSNYNYGILVKGVFTGGHSINGQIVYNSNSKEKEISVGRYNILENKGNTNPTHATFFVLDPIDNYQYNKIDDRPGELDDQGRKRSGYNLHPGNVSWGCVTICKSNTLSLEEREQEWNIIYDVISHTKTKRVPDNRGFHKYYPCKQIMYDTLKIIDR